MLLVLLLVVILALILWQVVRTYFDYKSGGAFDFKQVSESAHKTAASGLQAISSLQKWWKAATPEEKEKYRQKLSERTSMTVGTALSTAEAGKKAVESEGWFSGITGLFAGESKGRTALLNKCIDVENAIQNGKLNKEETQTIMKNIFEKMGVFGANTCELAKEKIKKMTDEKLIAVASAAMDELLKKQ